MQESENQHSSTKSSSTTHKQIKSKPNVKKTTSVKSVPGSCEKPKSPSNDSSRGSNREGSEQLPKVDIAARRTKSKESLSSKENVLKKKTLNLSLKEGKVTSVEDLVNMQSLKKEKSYNAEAARNFMKQKRMERGARMAEQQKTKLQEKEGLKKKLEELRLKQLQIVKNSAKREKEAEKPEWVSILDSVSAKDVGKEAKTSDKPDMGHEEKDKPKTKKRNATFKQSGRNENLAPLSDVNWPPEYTCGDRLGLEVKELEELTRKKGQMKGELSVDLQEGLQATNEFMLEVSQQMKLLTEHFKILSETKSRLGSAVTDTAVQVPTTDSHTSHDYVNQVAMAENAALDWMDRRLNLSSDPCHVKTFGSNNLRLVNSDNKHDRQQNVNRTKESPKDFMSVVRRRLDFIKKLKEEEDKEREKEILNFKEILVNDSRGSEVSLLVEKEGHLREVQPLVLDNSSDFKLEISSPRSRKKSEEFRSVPDPHELSLMNVNPDRDIEIENLLKHSNWKDILPDAQAIYNSCYKQKETLQDKKNNLDVDISERCDTTTISESLSTDPLKLPENLDRLSLNVENPTPTVEAKSDLNLDCKLKKDIGPSQLSGMAIHENLKLDTSCLDKLSVKQSLIDKPVKKSSYESIRTLISEISERFSFPNSEELPSTSKQSASHRNLVNEEGSSESDISKKGSVSERLEMIQNRKCPNEEVSQSTLRKLKLDNSLKSVSKHSIPEVIEKSLKSSRSVSQASKTGSRSSFNDKGIAQQSFQESVNSYAEEEKYSSSDQASKCRISYNSSKDSIPEIIEKSLRSSRLISVSEESLGSKLVYESSHSKQTSEKVLAANHSEEYSDDFVQEEYSDTVKGRESDNMSPSQAGFTDENKLCISSKSKYKERFDCETVTDEEIPPKTRRVDYSSSQASQSVNSCDKLNLKDSFHSVNWSKSNDFKFKIPKSRTRAKSKQHKITNKNVTVMAEGDTLAQLNDKFRNDYINQELTVSIRYRKNSSQSVRPSDCTRVQTDSSDSSHLSQHQCLHKFSSKQESLLSSKTLHELIDEVPAEPTKTFQHRIASEMKNLEVVSENLTRALARNKALSLENLHYGAWKNISFSKEKSIDPEDLDLNFLSIQPVHSDTTNNLSFESSVRSLIDVHKESTSLDSQDESSINVSKFSIRMLESLMKDEVLRHQQKASLLELRRETLLEKTKADLAWLSIERKKLKAKGKDEALRSVKKKQRGIILKCHQDFDEITRLQKIEKEASRDRILMLKRQIHLVMMQLKTKKYVEKLTPESAGKTGCRKQELVKAFPRTNPCNRRNLENQKRELEMREAMLVARRESLEAVAMWTKKVEEEEQRLMEVENIINPHQQISQNCVDRGTSPLNFGSDPGGKTVESSACSSQHNSRMPQTNSQSEGEKVADYYSDSFDQASVLSENVSSQLYSNPDKVGEERRKTIAIKVPLSPRVPPTKRRHSSGSDESLIYSHNETSEASDLEVRVSWLQQQLKQRKSELDLLKKQHSKSQRERLKAKEQSLISQINAYDAYIEQVKKEIQQEMDANSVKVVKPQIKQPRVVERKKHDTTVTSDKKVEEESYKNESFGDETSDNTESLNTLLESSNINNSQTATIEEDINKHSLEVKTSGVSIGDFQGKTHDEITEDLQTHKTDNSDLTSIKEDLKESKSDILSEISEEKHLDELKNETNISHNGSINETDDNSIASESFIPGVNTEFEIRDSAKDISFQADAKERSSESLSGSINEADSFEDISESDTVDMKTESLIRSLSISDKEDLNSKDLKPTIDEAKSLVERSTSPGEKEQKETSEYESPPSIVEDDDLHSLSLPHLEVPSSLSSIYSIERFDSVSATLRSAIQSSEHKLFQEFQKTVKETDDKKEDDITEVSLDEDFKESSEVIPNENETDICDKGEDQLKLNETFTTENENLDTDESINNSGPIILNDTYVIEENVFEDLDSVTPKDSLTTDKMMLQMLEDSFAVSDQLWKANLEEYKKIKEGTPFLTALQRENELTNSVDGISQQLFTDCLETATSDIVKIYLKKRALLSEECEHNNDILPVNGGDELHYYQEKNNVEEEAFWHDEASSKVLAEKEKLRLEQLQIEQEIEVLEQEAAGMRGFYLREIPNKPPPPYTPPRSRANITEQETLSAVSLGVSTIWDCVTCSKPTPFSPPAEFLSHMVTPPDSTYRFMMWDLCSELFFKAKPPPPPPCSPWTLTNNRKKLAPPPRTKEEIVDWAVKQASIIFGYQPAVQKENMIIRWSRKKRDRVDEILVRESQEEEGDWVDYSIEENQIKNRIAEALIEDMIMEAAKALGQVFTKKVAS